MNSEIEPRPEGIPISGPSRVARATSHNEYGAGGSSMSRSVPMADDPFSMTTLASQTEQARRSSHTFSRTQGVVPSSPGNYFGLHARRDSETSETTYSNRERSRESSDFWSSRRLRSGFSIFGEVDDESENEDDMVVMEDDDNAASEQDKDGPKTYEQCTDEDDEEELDEDEEEEEEEEEDDDDDDDESIDIFGHR